MSEDIRELLNINLNLSFYFLLYFSFFFTFCMMLKELTLVSEITKLTSTITHYNFTHITCYFAASKHIKFMSFEIEPV